MSLVICDELAADGLAPSSGRCPLVSCACLVFYVTVSNVGKFPGEQQFTTKKKKKKLTSLIGFSCGRLFIPSVRCVIRKGPQLKLYDGKLTPKGFFAALFARRLFSSNLIFIGHQERQAVLNLWFICGAVRCRCSLCSSPQPPQLFPSPDPIPF